TMSRIKTSTDSEAASKDADLIIEAIENLKTKQQLFVMLDKLAPEHILFCSNTSSLPIEETAGTSLDEAKKSDIDFCIPSIRSPHSNLETTTGPPIPE
ncbi:hypothetical protein BGZ65_004070, partial [Modicella reniformis]